MDIKKGNNKQTVGKCEDCVFYDYDGEGESYICMMNLDEDELARFIGGNTSSCPYYRMYDEYTTVRRQN